MSSNQMELTLTIYNQQILADMVHLEITLLVVPMLTAPMMYNLTCYSLRAMTDEIGIEAATGDVRDLQGIEVHDHLGAMPR